MLFTTRRPGDRGTASTRRHGTVLDPAVPFGGYKMSGYGKEGGVEHLDEYLNTKTVWMKLD